MADLGILLILGIGVFGGILGAWLFQHLKIPQVIGYIAIGLLIGESGLGIINNDNLTTLRPFTFMALGVIGFLVGGELEAKIFKKYGRQFLAIMLGEGLGAFMLVGTATGLLLFALTQQPVLALAGGLVFGAIASATDPASTIDVLWEYRSKGVLTTSLISVVALDDALAMTLYALGTSAANILLGGEASATTVLLHIAIELFGSVLLGLGCGFVLNYILRHSSRERTLTIIIGTLLLIAGTCMAFHLDVIISAMATGIVLVNLAPRRTHAMFKSVREFASPVYVMFFVLVGARLELGAMPWWIWALVALYVAGRSFGKYFGTMFGARISKSEPAVRKYLGFGLFAQGGVAVGLSIMASQSLSGIPVMDGLDLGQVVIYAVTATTLAVQIIGPPSVKYAITKAGEIGRNVTEEDIIAGLTVGDVMDEDVVTISEVDLMGTVFETISKHDQLAFPVVNRNGTCTGVISLESLKTLFTQQDIWSWMIAEDAMSDITDVVSPGMPLQEALDTMRQMNCEQTIVRNRETQEVVSVFDLRSARRKVTQRLVAATQNS